MGKLDWCNTLNNSLFLSLYVFTCLYIYRHGSINPNSLNYTNFFPLIFGSLFFFRHAVALLLLCYIHLRSPCALYRILIYRNRGWHNRQMIIIIYYENIARKVPCNNKAINLLCMSLTKSLLEIIPLLFTYRSSIFP